MGMLDSKRIAIGWHGRANWRKLGQHMQGLKDTILCDYLLLFDSLVSFFFVLDYHSSFLCYTIIYYSFGICTYVVQGTVAQSLLKV